MSPPDSVMCPNQAARSLVLRATRTLGLLVPEVTDPIHGQAVAGLEDEAALHGYTVIMANGFDDPEREARTLQVFARHQADGIAVLGGVVDQRNVLASVNPSRVVFVDGRTLRWLLRRTTCRWAAFAPMTGPAWRHWWPTSWKPATAASQTLQDRRWHRRSSAEQPSFVRSPSPGCISRTWVTTRACPSFPRQRRDLPLEWLILVPTPCCATTIRRRSSLWMRFVRTSCMCRMTWPLHASTIFRLRASPTHASQPSLSPPARWVDAPSACCLVRSKPESCNRSIRLPVQLMVRGSSTAPQKAEQLIGADKVRCASMTAIQVVVLDIAIVLLHERVPGPGTRGKERLRGQMQGQIEIEHGAAFGQPGRLQAPFGGQKVERPQLIGRAQDAPCRARRRARNRGQPIIRRNSVHPAG